LALKLLENRLRGVSADGYVMILAAVFILVVIFLPKGIAGLFESVTKIKPSRSTRHRQATLPTAVGEGDLAVRERPLDGSHG
jgi:hypothetical protein